MNSEPIRLGIIGAGFTGQQAAKNCGPLSRMTALALADPDEGRRRSVAEEFPVERVYGDYREVLDDGDVDAVYYGVPPDIRLRMVLEGFAAGKHALVQKPHATRAAQVLEMEAASRRAEKVLMFSYFFRHQVHNRRIRAAVERGRIGRVYHGRCFNRSAAPPPVNDFERWQHVYGNKGGPLGQHFSHDLDLLWWFMGCPQPQWAFAIKHTLHTPEPGAGAVPSENYFSGLVRFEGDRTIEISCSNVDQADSPKVFALYGTEGTITGEDPKRAASRGDDKAIFRRKGDGFAREEIGEEVEEEPYTEPPSDEFFFYQELEHFAIAIAGELEPNVPAAEAFTFMQILDALYDSALTEEKVPIG